MKKKAAPKKVPDCTSASGDGVYHGNMIHPRQLEEILSALEGIKIDPSRLSFAFPDDFWLKFWAGCFVACGHCSPDIALRSANDLLKQFKK